MFVQKALKNIIQKKLFSSALSCIQNQNLIMTYSMKFYEKKIVSMKQFSTTLN